MAEARATIRRGAARPAAPARRARATVPARPGLFARLLGLAPISPETVERTVTGAILAGGAAFALLILHLMGVPAMAGAALADLTARAGFQVKRVELNGVNNMDRLTVYAIAFDQHSLAMPLVDLDRVREQLLRYGWIADARVSRRLPDTLVVDLVERRPAAVWQHQGQLRLVDAAGVVLDDVSAVAMPDLPLLIGPGANRHAGALLALVDKVPALRPVLVGATWIGDRRWDLRFQSGETLALPEGDAAAQRALVKFARLDADRRLLGGQFVRFDMRDPTRFVARINRQARAIDEQADEAAIDAGDETAGDGAEGATAPGAGGIRPARPAAPRNGGLAKVSDSI
ncbi:FtsQ-type POTRA domain-containing protein [Sphingomonas changnyeongensis]|uniref:Cell division protein FtsQ n=1 Tax=Sphingomonas changnyeongensis TaxID=2698679 RepID=A0A7Z2NUB3_9SPHN|nr:cell division protein FtsQ/DivIB [Sphingomonas changnyeongensis]QHL89591.1 FtsQ-type POTRA domain-containing protein [Sphingomonas changnyeongensis]